MAAAADRGGLKVYMFGKNILVLVPHPDDEVVACAATIERAQKQGSVVSALYLTHGCLAQDTLWPWQRRYYMEYVERRRAEAEKAARFLNIAPLGWSMRPARHLWQEMRTVYAEIENAIAQHGIDQIWVPAYEGGNPDHDALNAIGARLKTKISVLEFAEYNFAKGQAHSQTFPNPKKTEIILALTSAEQKRKREALALYASEKSNLNYIKVARECYRPLADYDYRKPPHPGTLWYARFQWVPFRHPRVDFTKPADVSQAISAFLAATAPSTASGLPASATR